MTLQEFFYMGGYGAYIWSSYAAGFIVFLGLFISFKMQRKQLVNQIRRQASRQARQAQNNDANLGKEQPSSNN